MLGRQAATTMGGGRLGFFRKKTARCLRKRACPARKVGLGPSISAKDFGDREERSDDDGHHDTPTHVFIVAVTKETNLN
jgi:hypothetical protein